MSDDLVKASMGSVSAETMTAAAYASLGLHAAASTTGVAAQSHAAQKVGKRVVARGAALKSGERAAAETRRGRVADNVALKAATKLEQAAASKHLTMLAQIANSRMVAVASKAALPLLVARAAWEAGRGYQKDGVKGALLGGADALTMGRASATMEGFAKGGVGGAADALTFNIASWVADKASRATAAAKSDAPAPTGSSAPAPVRITRENAALARMYGETRALERQTQTAEAGGQTGGPRGFANPAVQFAAQSARGVQNVSDWAQAGQRTASAEPADDKRSARR